MRYMWYMWYMRLCSKSQLWDISSVYKEHEEYSEKADFDVL